MNRKQFEDIAAPVFNEMIKMLNELKQNILKKKIPVHSIELIGGGTRIPFFLEIVNKIFGEPSRTLNSSESVAKGSAILAAVKSPIFRVPDYKIH